MSDGKKQITLTNEQAKFVYFKISDNRLCPLPDLNSMRMVTRLLDAIEPNVLDMENRVKLVRKNYSKFKVMQPGDEPTEYVPMSAVEAFQNEVQPIADEPHTYECDREALAKVKFLFDKIVSNAYKNQNGVEEGLGGRFESRMFTTISDALAEATVIKEE